MSKSYDLLALCLSEDIETNANILLDAVEDKKIIMLFTGLWDNDPRELWQIPEAKKLFFDTISMAAVIVGMEGIKNTIEIILSSLDSETRTLLRTMQSWEREQKSKSKPIPPWCN